ncbi:bacterial extracellular solute-binding protein, family 3 domain-containing protein [Ditylenchus destructor]|nr:bacterial extracellular solute-binding protein, family 3 domain-containing protein [Ditylenchus destructor]
MTSKTNGDNNEKDPVDRLHPGALAGRTGPCESSTAGRHAGQDRQRQVHYLGLSRCVGAVFLRGDNSGKPMGYSVELASKIVERIQQKTGVATLNVKYNLVTPRPASPCGRSRWRFSYGFIYVKGQLLTAKDSGIKGFPDLAGKNVVTTAGTTNERFLKSYNAEYKTNMFVISAKDHGEAFKMLETGRAAAFYMDDALLYGERAKAKDPHNWVVVGEEHRGKSTAACCARTTRSFLRWSTRHLATFTAVGDQRDLPALVRITHSAKGLNLEFPMTRELKAIIAKPISDPVE